MDCAERSNRAAGSLQSLSLRSATRKQLINFANETCRKRACTCCINCPRSRPVHLISQLRDATEALHLCESPKKMLSIFQPNQMQSQRAGRSHAFGLRMHGKHSPAAIFCSFAAVYSMQRNLPSTAIIAEERPLHMLNLLPSLLAATQHTA